MSRTTGSQVSCSKSHFAHKTSVCGCRQAVRFSWNLAHFAQENYLNHFQIWNLWINMNPIWLLTNKDFYSSTYYIASEPQALWLFCTNLVVGSKPCIFIWDSTLVDRCRICLQSAPFSGLIGKISFYQNTPVQDWFGKSASIKASFYCKFLPFVWWRQPGGKVSHFNRSWQNLLLKAVICFFKCRIHFLGNSTPPKMMFCSFSAQFFCWKTSPVKLSLPFLWPGNGQEGEASRVHRGAVSSGTAEEETQGPAGLHQGAGVVQHGVLI